MRWLQSEYLLKGAYLGLVLFAALQAAAPDGSADSLARINLCALAGLGLALAVSALNKLREGYRIKGRLVVFLLFLLLESHTLVYAGILLGTLAGIWINEMEPLFLPALGGGVVVGFVLALLRDVRRRRVRVLLILALAAALVAGVLLWFNGFDGKVARHPLDHPDLFGVQLLLGIPFFYLLTFAGQAEETEVEIGVLCALLGLGLVILLGEQPQFRLLPYVIPVVLYFFYTGRVLPGLRVFKHAFRGYGYARAGNHRRALIAFRRALQLDPANRLAREGFWEVHRSLDLDQLARDPETLALVDLELCLDRAGSLLVAGKPTPAQLDEALRLLDLVLRLQPDLHPRVDYWRAVAHLHGRQYEQAAVELEHVVDPHHYGPDNPQRRPVLLPAWQLALTLHEEMRRRVGAPQIGQPGRRMEAIAAVERHLAEQPDDKIVWGLKRMLYQELTEAEYLQALGNVDYATPLPGDEARRPAFDYGYVQQLGLALIDDSARWQRGGEYLRMAAHGLPTLGPTIFVQIAQAHQRAGHADDARHNYELAKRAGRSIGPKNLGDEERQAYFATVRLLGEDALARGDLDAALENYHLYAESERSGIETLRTLAELHERKGDALSAARAADQALAAYNAKDKDLLERKDRYYYSIMPDDLRARLEWAQPWFDVDYCLRKTRSVLDARTTDLEWLDVAHHLIQLALVVRPGSLLAKVLLARVLLRHGEREKAMALLEEVHSPKPEKFASAEDEDAWFVCCQLLGDLYMEVGQPDRAAGCFLEFRKSSKSGAATLYKLGQAKEQLGDLKAAARYYQQVTAYEGNPLVPDAHDALRRLEEG